MKLIDLLKQLNDNPKDVDLYHWDCDSEAYTMAALSLKDFTASGLTEFQIALNMDVERVQEETKSWLSVWVKGAHHSQVERLSMSHAGYCSVDDYNDWFTMDSKRSKS